MGALSRCVPAPINVFVLGQHGLVIVSLSLLHCSQSFSAVRIAQCLWLCVQSRFNSLSVVTAMRLAQ